MFSLSLSLNFPRGIFCQHFQSTHLRVLASADDNKAGRRAPTIAALATTAPVPREANFNTNCVTWEILMF